MANLTFLRSEVARLQSLADRRGEIAVERRREIERLRLTDEERAALHWFAHYGLPEHRAATLRGLLERLGTIGHQE